MTDPTATERDALVARLESAAPSGPDLTGLADRAQDRARHTRRLRRAGAAGVLVLAVAAIITVPHLVGSPTTRPGGPAVTSRAPGHPCSGRPDHRDFTQGTAAWVSFCPARLAGQVAALTPSGVLVSGAASLVASWQADTRRVHSCPPPFGAATEYSVRVGFTDGTSTRIDGVTGSCQAAPSPGEGNLGIEAGSSVYSGLVRALGRQASSGQQRYNPPGPPRACPRSPDSAGRLNIDGASAAGLHDSSFLLDMTAVEGLVCRYDGFGALAASGPAPDPEGLRIASGSSVMRSPFQRWRASPTTSYVVSLRDRTDTWRTFVISGRKHALTFLRGPAPGVRMRLGFAGEDLLLLVHNATR